MSKLVFRAIITAERSYKKRPTEYKSEIKKIYTHIGVKADYYNINEDVYDRIWVSPEDIQLVTGRNWKPWSKRLAHFGCVKGGDWDNRDVPDVPTQHKPYPKRFDEQVLFTSSREHFLNGVPWEQTPLYKRHVEILESTDDTSIQTESDIDYSLNKYDLLFDNILENGYKSQLELSNLDDSYMDTLIDEILIDIGRDGELLFVDGKHRLSISKLLDINKIPVVVLVRHEQHVK